MNHLDFFILSLASLFAIIAPIPEIPLFLSITPNDLKQRNRIARTSCIVAALVLACFALLGESIFSFLGITMPAFQIAGGILLFGIALEMLQANEKKLTPEETSQAAGAKENVAITPLAVPILAGPVAISTTILLKDKSSGWFQDGLVYLAILSVMSVSCVVFILAARSSRWISPILLKIVRRLMGLMLAAIATQFVLNGIAAANFFNSSG